MARPGIESDQWGGTRAATDSPGPIVLTGRQFVELASGYGDAEAVAVLTAGQATKRRLMVRILADTLADLPAVSEAVAVLDAAESRDAAAAGAALEGPFVDSWATAVLSPLLAAAEGAVDDRTGGGPVSQDAAAAASAATRLGTLAIAAAVRAGQAFRLTLTDTGGRVMVPGLGSASGLGPGPVEVSGDGDHLVLAGGTGTVIVGPPSDEEQPGWRPLRRLGTMSTPSAHAEDVILDDLDPDRDCFDWPPTPRLMVSEVEALRTVWAGAQSLIANHHSSHIPAMAMLRSLVPVTSPAPGRAVSAVSRRAVGCVAMSVVGDPESLAELLIHETQHMKLGALLDLVALYRPGGPARHFAPWRPDPRPVGALLQGVYAHLGVADYWRARATGSAAGTRIHPDTAGASADFEFALWRHQIANGMASLLASGELTDLGIRFADGMARTLRSWHDLAVDDRCAAEAKVVAHGHTVRWKLANRATSTDTTTRLVLAWLASAACPSWAGSASLDVATPPVPGQLRLAAVARAGSAAAGGAGDPDRLLLAGRAEAALRAYCQAIRGTGGSEDWVGLAVAARHRRTPGSIVLNQRPEVVRALHTALAAGGDPAGVPDPIRLADWLATAHPRD